MLTLALSWFNNWDIWRRIKRLRFKFVTCNYKKWTIMSWLNLRSLITKWTIRLMLAIFGSNLKNWISLLLMFKHIFKVYALKRLKKYNKNVRKSFKDSIYKISKSLDSINLMSRTILRFTLMYSRNKRKKFHWSIILK